MPKIEQETGKIVAQVLFCEENDSTEDLSFLRPQKRILTWPLFPFKIIHIWFFIKAFIVNIFPRLVTSYFQNKTPDTDVLLHHVYREIRTILSRNFSIKCSGRDMRFDSNVSSDIFEHGSIAVATLLANSLLRTI